MSYSATVQVYRLSDDGAGAPSSSALSSFEVTAETSDRLYAAAQDEARKRFGQVRGVYSGPSGLFAYVGN
jgi:hypothetical protein